MGGLAVGEGSDICGLGIGRGRKFFCAVEWEGVLFEHGCWVVRGAVDDDVKCAGAEDESTVWVVSGKTYMIPVRVGEDHVVDVFGWVEAAIDEGSLSVGEIDDGLAIGEVVLHALGVQGEVAFDA